MTKLLIGLALIVVFSSCERIIIEKAENGNSIKSLTLSPSPTKEFIFSPDENEYVITYPHWIDKFYMTLVLADTSASYRILTKEGVELGNPMDINMGLNVFKVVVYLPHQNKYQNYSFSVVRNPWIHVSENTEFQARDGAGVVVFKDKIWLMGGWLGNGEDGRPSGTVSEIWYSDDGEKWVFAGEAPWKSRHSFTPVIFKDKIWIVGGDGNNDVWNSEDGTNWNQVLENAPWGHRYAPFIFSFENKLWLMGGISWWDDEGNYVYPDGVPTVSYNDVWSSSDGVHWERISEHAPWKPRGIVHGSVVFNGKMWIIGGGVKGDDITSAYNDVWTTTDGLNWNLITANAEWEPRIHFSTVVHNGMIWLTDGSVFPKQSNLSNEVWNSTDGKTWTRLYGTPWLERHASSLVSFRGELIITCGAVPGNVVNDVWKIDSNF